jgi:multidrug resistance efflux pump
MSDQSHLLMSLSYTLDDPRVPGEMRKAAAEITSLKAEVEQNAIDLEEYRRDVEKLRAALRECEAELNAYYRMQHPGDHPYSQQELAQTMASNPATVALKETSND